MTRMTADQIIDFSEGIKSIIESMNDRRAILGHLKGDPIQDTILALDLLGCSNLNVRRGASDFVKQEIRNGEREEIG